MNNHDVYSTVGKLDKILLQDLKSIEGISPAAANNADVARRQLLYLRCIKCSITILEDKYLAVALNFPKAK